VIDFLRPRRRGTVRLREPRWSRRDGREWIVQPVFIVRRGWRVSVLCEGYSQGCWGEFPTERAAIRYGWARARHLAPLVPHGREDSLRGATWA